MRSAIITLAVSVLASVALAQDVTVKLTKLVENRELSVEKTAFSGWDNGIEMTLHIDGPAVKGARKFGKVQITKATDDVGTDLMHRPEDAPSFDNDQFQEIREPQSFGMDDKSPKPTGFDVDAKLPTPSARKATTITQISGSVQVLVGGEKKIVEVKNIKQNFGKTIDDPALKAVGVTFMLADPANPGQALVSNANADNTVNAFISGKLDEIASVNIVDAAGEAHSRGASWSDANDKRTISYDLDKPLADDMVLQIEVWPGQKTITVPIELKDVKLP